MKRRKEEAKAKDAKQKSEPDEKSSSCIIHEKSRHTPPKHAKMRSDAWRCDVVVLSCLFPLCCWLAGFLSWAFFPPFAAFPSSEAKGAGTGLGDEGMYIDDF